MDDENKLNNIVNAVYSKTLGSELASANPVKNAETIYKERCAALEALLKSRLEPDEYIAYGFSWIDGKETVSIHKKSDRAVRYKK